VLTAQGETAALFYYTSNRRDHDIHLCPNDGKKASPGANSKPQDAISRLPAVFRLQLM